MSSVVSQKLLTECQALIAFACYDSPVIMQEGMSMRESTIESLMAKHCYGNPKESKDSGILTYVDQFLHGLNKLSGLYEPTSRELDQQDVLTMLPALHCQNGLNIYVGEGSIEKELLYQKSLSNTNQQISGRTLLRLAKEVLCNCKKMMALVTDTTSPYKSGTYPSGRMTWDDFARWCLSALYSSKCGVSKSTVNFGEENNADERGRADEFNVNAETMKMSSSTSALVVENSDATAKCNKMIIDKANCLFRRQQTILILCLLCPWYPQDVSSRAILHGVFVGDTYLSLLRVHRQQVLYSQMQR